MQVTDGNPTCSIVYRNNSMNIYYVYAYLREDLTPYYIGKGKNNRAYIRNKKERIHKPTDPKRIIILHGNLTEQEAFEKEMYYIQLYGRKDISSGILHNLSNGGEGNAGRVSPNKGKKFGPQSPELIAKRASAISKAKLGIKFSPEHRAAMSKSRIGRPSKLKGLKRPEVSEGRKGISSGLWFNNGIENIKSKECPDGFFRGRLPWKNSDKKEKI